MKDIRIKPAEKGDRTVYLQIGIWLSDKDGNIHITAPGVDKHFHTWVTDKPSSIRCHKSLFGHLKRILQEQGRWPQPDPDQQVD